MGLVRQQEFYRHFLRPYEGGDRVIVIISDALRYECAKELMQRFEYDEKCEAKMDTKSIYQELISLSGEILEEMQDVFERFDRGYSASRFDDAYKNLVTLSEILLIGYNSNDKRAASRKESYGRIIE